MVFLHSHHRLASIQLWNRRAVNREILLVLSSSRKLLDFSFTYWWSHGSAHVIYCISLPCIFLKGTNELSFFIYTFLKLNLTKNFSSFNHWVIVVFFFQCFRVVYKLFLVKFKVTFNDVFLLFIEILLLKLFLLLLMLLIKLRKFDSILKYFFIFKRNKDRVGLI